MKEVWHSVKGMTESGSESFVSINKNKDTGKIHVFIPEDMEDVILTVKQAKKLIEEIHKCILE